MAIKKIKDNCQKRVGWLGKSFCKYPGKGDKPDVAISVKYHELELSSLKRVRISPCGDAGQVGKSHCLGKKWLLGQVLPQGIDVATSQCFCQPSST